VYIEDGVTVERSEIGPNVSLERGTRVSGSKLRNAIVGREAKITDSALDGALLGNHVVVEGYRGGASLGDHTEVTAKG
jgi:glucose-1-phosphate thymidylyltransferase